MIEGVTLRDVVMRRDERGHLGELFSENFGDKLCHVYRCRVAAGIAKGFHSHLLQTDRFTPIRGTVKVGLVDLRGAIRASKITVPELSGVTIEEALRLVCKFEDGIENWHYIGIDGRPRLFSDVFPTDEAWVGRVGESSTFAQHQTAILEAEDPQVLFIPPGVAHGIYSLSHDCAEILNAPTVTFNREAPDELRMPADSFGYVWRPQSR